MAHVSRTSSIVFAIVAAAFIGCGKAPKQQSSQHIKSPPSRKADRRELVTSRHDEHQDENAKKHQEPARVPAVLAEAQANDEKQLGAHGEDVTSSNKMALQMQNSLPGFLEPEDETPTKEPVDNLFEIRGHDASGIWHGLRRVLREKVKNVAPDRVARH